MNTLPRGVQLGKFYALVIGNDNYQGYPALRSAGLVRERREGRHAYYRADPQGLAPLVNWIERYRDFWPERIEKLKDVLKRMDP